MSTVSLMPVGKKIRVKREIRVPVISVLSTAENLKSSGCLIGSYTERKLILDEGAVVRIEAFSAATKDKGYPGVKLTVFPEGGKSGSLYVSLGELDGFSWESLDEEPRKPGQPKRRIDVSLDMRRVNFDHIWHEVFGRNNFKVVDEIAIINPLVLSDIEIEEKEFKIVNTHNIGEALVKIGRESWEYSVQFKVTHNFDLIFPHHRLLSARYNHMTVELQVRSNYSYADKDWVTISEVIDTPEKFVQVYLEEKHPN